MNCRDWSCKHNSTNYAGSLLELCRLSPFEVDMNEFHECESYEEKEDQDEEEYENE